MTQSPHTPADSKTATLAPSAGPRRAAREGADGELRRLTAAQELARLGSWEWDIPSNRVSWSEELYRIWGVAPGRGPVTFESYLERLHADDVASAQAVIGAAMETGAPFEFMHRIVRPDGVRWIHSRGEAVRDEAGRIRLLRGTAQDVTAQRALEEQALQLAREQAARAAAEAAAAKLRFLADASAQLAASLDYEETLRNVARLAVPGYADWCAVDIVGAGGEVRRLAVEHTDPKRVAFVHRLQEHYPSDPDAAHGVQRVLRTGEPELVEEIPESLLAQGARDAEHLELIRTLGLRSYAIVPLRVEQAVLGTLTFVQAESGRRFTRADLPLLEDLARRAAVAIHNAQLVTELSAAHGQLEQQASELEAQTIELEEMMAELEQRNDELTALNDEALQAREAAERANEAKSQFLASMSHELRTPLNAIAGYSELLELGIPGAVNPEQREIIGRIQRNQRRLLGLINDILNFTRLSTTRLEFPVAPVRVAPLISGLEHLIGPQIERKRLRYEIGELPGDACVLASAERLEQILLNLVSNAVKFTAPGGLIRVGCEVLPEAVRITVLDSGRGIPTAEHASIFEPFVQVSPEPARENAGVGLGLAISRELARAMDGDIEVESEPGQGSRFTVSLPRSQAA